ncbi:HK97 family phage prohead protease [Agathobaculum sp.]|uniref:HK97 family phage prohead protease n=1 Tax=Agathobaculum sp. TaxID=2048138 RepID=UPI003A8EB4A5
MKLYEVSVVTFPAYEDTSVEARRKDFEKAEKRRKEEWQARMKSRLKGEDNGT